MDQQQNVYQCTDEIQAPILFLYGERLIQLKFALVTEISIVIPSPTPSLILVLFEMDGSHEVQSRILLDEVVGESPSVLQLLAGKDQPLLIQMEALLVLKPNIS